MVCLISGPKMVLFLFSHPALFFFSNLFTALYIYLPACRLPMYNEAKLAFFIYLWYPKTMVLYFSLVLYRVSFFLKSRFGFYDWLCLQQGTTYIYETFFRPYISRHENDIDRNLLELRARACDVVVLYWQKATSYGQTTFFDVLQYVALQSSSLTSRSGSAQVLIEHQYFFSLHFSPFVYMLLVHHVKASSSSSLLLLLVVSSGCYLCACH